MKNDPYFKFVAAIVIAGVFIALLAPTRNVTPADPSVHAAVTHDSTEAAQ